jgi:hypothetical protein
VINGNPDVVDPNNSMNALQYSVNGVFATGLNDGIYDDITPANNPFAAGDTLGGYFQIQTVPEPSTLAFLGLGLLPLTRLLRRRA